MFACIAQRSEQVHPALAQVLHIGQPVLERHLGGHRIVDAARSERRLLTQAPIAQRLGCRARLGKSGDPGPGLLSLTARKGNLEIQQRPIRGLLGREWLFQLAEDAGGIVRMRSREKGVGGTQQIVVAVGAAVLGCEGLVHPGRALRVAPVCQCFGGIDRGRRRALRSETPARGQQQHCREHHDRSIDPSHALHRVERPSFAGQDAGSHRVSSPETRLP